MQLAAILVALLCGCAARAIEDADDIYARDDGSRVLCGLGIDGEGISVDDLESAMVHARDVGEVLLLFAHEPGRTIRYERVEQVLTLADSVGLETRTFSALERGRAGLSLGFDDAFVDAWFGMRDMLRAHHARVTFFVSNYDELDAKQRNMLHELLADGHAIEAHGMGHRNAAEYVDVHGLARYMRDEIEPLLEAMTRDGFAPSTFAYPFGDRTSELDSALLEHFTLLRSVTYLDRGWLNTAPCPR
jgi:hypothetical protein